MVAIPNTNKNIIHTDPEPGDGGIFFIRMNHILQKIRIKEILWIQANGNYCYLYMAQKKFAIKASLTKLVARLPAMHFIRIHKSCMVQLACVDRIDLKQNIVTIGETNLPLGRIYKEKMLEIMDIL